MESFDDMDVTGDGVADSGLALDTDSDGVADFMLVDSDGDDLIDTLVVEQAQTVVATGEPVLAAEEPVLAAAGGEWDPNRTWDRPVTAGEEVVERSPADVAADPALDQLTNPAVAELRAMAAAGDGFAASQLESLVTEVNNGELEYAEEAADWALSWVQDDYERERYEDSESREVVDARDERQALRDIDAWYARTEAAAAEGDGFARHQLESIQGYMDGGDEDTAAYVLRHWVNDPRQEDSDRSSFEIAELLEERDRERWDGEETSSNVPVDPVAPVDQAYLASLEAETASLEAEAASLEAEAQREAEIAQIEEELRSNDYMAYENPYQSY